MKHCSHSRAHCQPLCAPMAAPFHPPKAPRTASHTRGELDKHGRIPRMLQRQLAQIMRPGVRLRV
eukprot:1376434-Alexandrium_andersonii.AAC.1